MIRDWIEFGIILCALYFWIDGAYLSRYELAMLIILAIILAAGLYLIGLVNPHFLL